MTFAPYSCVLVRLPYVRFGVKILPSVHEISREIRTAMSNTHGTYVSSRLHELHCHLPPQFRVIRAGLESRSKGFGNQTPMAPVLAFGFNSIQVLDHMPPSCVLYWSISQTPEILASSSSFLSLLKSPI